ncbi:MAG: phosphoribosylformylglycinamidine cyclo-ligase [FCB group bacterium]|jgi:phosphoribosylformylglycinamidine cyclo-ligase|nr:phosphoribosylformylglycinamidine cyclo-ligase [FCB group bacterium]
MPEKKKPSLSYRDAGVNIDAWNQAFKSLGGIVKKTYDDNVLQDIGSFGAMYNFDMKNMEEPVLVSSVDGVGTKLKLAFMTGRHDTVGVDLVSHCVNDILVQGAKPLFFLDYFAVGKLDPEVVVQVITGLSNGCRYAGCALIGGETAELPDMYNEGEYDLAGTIVGVVDRKNIVDGSTIKEGDVIIGLASTGLHTNGYSLARKIVFEVAGLGVNDAIPEVGRTVGDALLEPHRSYARTMQILMKVVRVKGMAHITGGGITDNLPRTLPQGLGAEIDLGSWVVPPLFKFLRDTGNVEALEMLRTFNMGMGFLVVVPAKDADKAMETLTMSTEHPRIVGRVIKGERKVHYKGELRYAAQS